MAQNVHSSDSLEADVAIKYAKWQPFEVGEGDGKGESARQGREGRGRRRRKPAKKKKFGKFTKGGYKRKFYTTGNKMQPD